MRTGGQIQKLLEFWPRFKKAFLNHAAEVQQQSSVLADLTLRWFMLRKTTHLHRFVLAEMPRNCTDEISSATDPGAADKTGDLSSSGPLLLPRLRRSSSR